MTIYESKGFGSLLYPYRGDFSPFDYIANFKPLSVPEGADIESYKRQQAPYCLSGTVRADKKGTYRRNNDSLKNRDLIFLDYDDLRPDDDFIERVNFALAPYSYIIYPTIKHKADRPRYRLVVLPSRPLVRDEYMEAVKEIAELIGLPFDPASLTWSQLQGLPVTTGRAEDYQKIINRGKPYPIKGQAPESQHAPLEARNFRTDYRPSNRAGQPSMTMRVIDTLLNGFGDEGGRNMALARFCGLLFNKWVDCDLATAWELVQVANNQTADPLPMKEVEKTFESIARAEYRKRG